MDIRIYAINLDHSVDRWNILSHQAKILDLPLVRISGIDGVKTSPANRSGCDTRAFERNNGRTILPGEYGCYRSHLKALFTFLETDESAGIIVEDDIQLSAELIHRTHAILEVTPDADAIKLFNHRIVGFIRTATSIFGDKVGRAMHGPQGSTACYAVTRSGAQKLIVALQTMEYPWDIALERGWATGTRIYTTRHALAVPTRDSTTIATRSVYRSSKFPWWKRLSTYGIRIIESGRRIAYALDIYPKISP